jgi:hypothetical protein
LTPKCPLGIVDYVFCLNKKTSSTIRISGALIVKIRFTISREGEAILKNRGNIKLSKNCKNVLNISSAVVRCSLL